MISAHDSAFALKFTFFLILGILKIILFVAENLQNPSFYIKENSSGRKSEIKICLFYFISF